MAGKAAERRQQEAGGYGPGSQAWRNQAFGRCPKKGDSALGKTYNPLLIHSTNIGKVSAINQILSSLLGKHKNFLRYPACRYLFSPAY